MVNKACINEKADPDLAGPILVDLMEADVMGA
jgi:hypothetical protein